MQPMTDAEKKRLDQFAVAAMQVLRKDYDLSKEGNLEKWTDYAYLVARWMAHARERCHKNMSRDDAATDLARQVIRKARKSVT